LHNNHDSSLGTTPATRSTRYLETVLNGVVKTRSPHENRYL
jgi:hypothetical protein